MKYWNTEGVLQTFKTVFMLRETAEFLSQTRQRCDSLNWDFKSVLKNTAQQMTALPELSLV